MSHTILYIEDNPMNMRLVRRMLSTTDYQLIEAENGLDGLDAVDHYHPDLILMDINLPDIDGLEATRCLKAHPDVAHIPVIALTSNIMIRDRQEALEAGCDGYLPKPVSRTELLWTINAHLNDKPMSRADVLRTVNDDETTPTLYAY